MQTATQEESIDFMDFFAEQNTVKIQKKPWMDECTFTLVTDQNISQCIDTCLAAPKKRVAIDLETTGLDSRVVYQSKDSKYGRTVDHIVGIGLCPDGKTGFYIPLKHRDPIDKTQLHTANVTWSVFNKQFRRLTDAVDAGEIVAIFHNGEFDQEFLDNTGEEPFGNWDIPDHWDDSLIQIYLDNSRLRSKGLKMRTKEDFGCEMIELDELYTAEERSKANFKPNFALLDPTREEIPWYVCGDVIFTYRHDEKNRCRVVNPDPALKLPNQSTIYKIEKLCVSSNRWMMRNRIAVDMAKVKELVTVGQKEWFESVMEVYREGTAQLGRDIMPAFYKVLQDKFVHDDTKNCLDDQIDLAKSQAKSQYADPEGYLVKTISGVDRQFPLIYDVNSPAQLGNLFLELGVPGLTFTEKSGQVATSKDLLDAIIDETGDKFPFMGKIKRFREVSKALSNYLYPMLRYCDPTDQTMRINFRGHKVDTGRYATPSGDNSEAMLGWPHMNLQSMPAMYDPNRPECMRRLRETIVARDGRFIVAIDFSGVELRLNTNLSLESKWLEEFFHCSNCNFRYPMGDGKSTPEAPPPRCQNCGSDKIGDLHTLTALSIYGADAQQKADWKQLRAKSKSVNFALAYGGGGAAVVRAADVDKQEGWRIKSVFDETYTGLKRWWLEQHKTARENLYVTTAFGRKYPVPDITSPDGGFRSKAERNACNGPIQGVSADITKLAMGLIYKEMKKRNWHREKVLMIITMHDELVFEIAGDILEEAIELIKHIMTRNPLILAKRWPVPLTSDVEIGPSWAVPWALNDMRACEVRFDGDKKIKDAKKAAEYGLDWDTLSNFPAILQPYFRYQTFDGLKEAIKIWNSTEPNGELPKGSKLTRDVSKTIPAKPMDSSIPGTDYSFRLNCPMTLPVAKALGNVIAKCRNRGTKQLHLLDQEGNVLVDWNPYDTPVLVHETEFHVLARDAGIAD